MTASNSNGRCGLTRPPVELELDQLKLMTPVCTNMVLLYGLMRLGRTDPSSTLEHITETLKYTIGLFRFDERLGAVTSTVSPLPVISRLRKSSKY